MPDNITAIFASSAEQVDATAFLEAAAQIPGVKPMGVGMGS